MIFIEFFGALLLGQAVSGSSQTLPAAPQAPAPIESSGASVRLNALTPLRLRVEGEISSKTHVTGDKIVIVLADPLRVTDTLQIPAGTRGVGEVVHSAKKGMGGKAGELLIAARTLDVAPGVSVPLRSFRLDPASGKNKQGVATGLMIAGGAVGGVAALIITGGSASVPDGSEAFAKTASDVDLPIGALVPLNSGVLMPATVTPLTVTSSKQ